MKEDFVKYLESIGITECISKKIEMIYEYYKTIHPDEIADIFVTEYINEDGDRVYENLWFFSKIYCMEAKQFLTKDDFDITPIQSRIEYWNIQKQDYNIKKSTEKSRLFLKFQIDNKIRAEFKASKENCDYLWDIILRYVMSNLKD